MATPTYTLIDSTVLGSATSTITFSSIPADYRDLIVVFRIDPDATTAFDVTFNNDTGSNYTGVYAAGFGTGYTPQSGTESTTYLTPIPGFSSGSNYLYILQIMDYSATDKHKTVLGRTQRLGAGAGSDQVRMLASRWANTSAITEIDIDSRINTFPAGTTAYLYGIEA